MLFGKRGQYSTTFIIFLAVGLLIGGGGGLILLQKVAGTLDGTILEQNYIARDFALTLDAVYASPGELSYTYDLKHYLDKFVIEVREGRVIVRKDNVESSYRVVGSSGVDLQIVAKDEGKQSKLLLTKTFISGSPKIIISDAENTEVEPLG